MPSSTSTALLIIFGQTSPNRFFSLIQAIITAILGHDITFTPFQYFQTFRSYCAVPVTVQQRTTEPQNTYKAYAAGSRLSKKQACAVYLHIGFCPGQTDRRRKQKQYPETGTELSAHIGVRRTHQCNISAGTAYQRQKHEQIL